MDESLDQAEAAVRSGDLARAERLYRTIEARDGESAAAHYGLGFIALHDGRAEAARARLSACLALEPDRPKALAALGSAELALGRPQAALEAFEAAQAAAPSLAGAANIAAAALAAGQGARALASLDAMASSDTALKPNERAECLRLKAQTLTALARPEEALVCASEAHRLDPRSPTIRQTLGAGLRRARRSAEGLEHLTAAWAAGLRTRATALEIAASHQALRAGAACLTWVDQALADDGSVEGPREIAALWAQAAGLLERENALERAGAAIEKALSLDPLNRAARLSAATIARRQGDLANAQARVDALLAEPDGGDYRALQFEAARLADLRGDSVAALAHAERGNEIAGRAPHAARMAADRRARLDRLEADLDAIRRAGDPMAAASASDREGPRAAFLVGAPRSGTTLAGERLNRHPALAVAIETPAIERAVALCEDRTGRAYPACAVALDPQTADEARALVRQIWRDALGEDYEQAVVVLDQHPLNAERMLLATALFPEAPILALKRDPRDVALSCFLQDFRLNRATSVFLDLQESAERIAQTLRLAETCLALAPNPITHLRFEELVAAPQTGFTALVAALGLPGASDGEIEWTAGTRGAAARTASYAQVTEPINDRGVDRWRRYRAGPPADWWAALEPAARAAGYPSATR